MESICKYIEGLNTCENNYLHMQCWSTVEEEYLYSFTMPLKCKQSSAIDDHLASKVAVKSLLGNVQ